MKSDNDSDFRENMILDEFGNDNDLFLASVVDTNASNSNENNNNNNIGPLTVALLADGMTRERRMRLVYMHQL